ncbi:E3 ubiquitin-protein ligase RNF25 [Anabrus simplex]|uniref:E3 ubiquitin-protein ligase RNF25 n=1 Tax=Anabrus simplex TaxID=316456 RepID=UPI0034DD9784
MSTDLDERVVDEVEALKAILMDELAVKTSESGCPSAVEIVLYPSTAHDAVHQYVRITLVVELPPGYPDSVPTVHLRNPRGLDDSVLDKITREVKEKCSDFCGQPVIYELIELVKEHLTASNLPSCQCAICLYGFKEGDHFTKTQCYHYFHSYCLAAHVTNTERSFHEEQEKLPAWQRDHKGYQVLCPVCREVIACDLEELKSAPQPLDVENARHFELSDELRSLQEQMAALFSYQKQRGGIIDLEAEESKLVLVTDPQREEDPPGPSLPSVPPRLPKLDQPPPPPMAREGEYGPRSWRRGRGGRGGGRKRYSQPATSR